MNLDMTISLESSNLILRGLLTSSRPSGKCIHILFAHHIDGKYIAKK